MTDEERETENIFKNNKLGKWGKGLQKGLRIYQKETYDEERESMEAQAITELRMGESNVVTDMNREIFEINTSETSMTNDDILQQETSIKDIVNDDDYGDLDGDEMF